MNAVTPILKEIAAYARTVGEFLWTFVDQWQSQWILYLIWGGLFGATFLLMRMLVTRWGDSDVTKKALLLSLVLHLVAGLWTTTIEVAKGSRIAQEKGPVPIRRIITETKQQRDSREAATKPTPVWEKVSRPLANTVTRAEPAAAAPVREKDLPRDSMPAETPSINIPDLPSLPNQPIATPLAIRSAERANRTTDGTKVKIEEETAESRPDATVGLPSPTRQAQTPSGLKSSDMKREPRPASTGDVAVTLKPSKEMAALKLPSDPKATLRRASDAEQPLPKAGAVPSTVIADEPATTTGAPQSASVPGTIAGSRFSRQGRRMQPEAGDSSAPRLRSNPQPATTEPDERGMIAARAGVRELPSEGLTPNIGRPEAAGAISKGGARVPAEYRLRNLPQRSRIAVEMGATENSERSVEASLAWLAKHQNPEGFWDADGFVANCPAGDRCTGAATLGQVPAADKVNIPERERAGIAGDAGLTGLTVLAFLGAGYTQEEGLYADNIDRALRWLIRKQTPEGSLAGTRNYYARMYCHGMATIAVGEAYGMTRDANLREPLARAVQYIVDTQNSDGGWRYIKSNYAGDMSMFGWQLMALKSARTAGLEVDGEAFTKAVGFLKAAGQGESGGLAAYRKGERPTSAMTAEALFCRQILGMQRSNPATTEAVERLLQHTPRRSEQDLYYWYYGTLAMYHYGSKPWKTWNAALRDTLVADQRTDGHAAGSWDPHAPWGDYGGRIFSTAMSTLCLEVYYRFLPLYQGGAEDSTGK